jgi:NAD(P)-dependent dehydrogenase (short-subunit alcohol dehydrogenase family)
MLDSNRLEGKTALVTGGASEIGAAAICLMRPVARDGGYAAR